MIRKNLVGHTLLCGFGAKGEYAARELLSGNLKPEQIVVVDPDAGRVELALALGMLGIQGDATQNDVLKAARISSASAVLVSTSRDDAAALVVLSARQLNPKVPISVTARAQENEDLLYQAGATFVLNPVRIGGHLLARSGGQHHAVNYLADLATAGGDVLLRERVATDAEVGLPLAEISTGLGLRLLRKGQPVGTQDDPVRIVAAGDVIIEIVTTANG